MDHLWFVQCLDSDFERRGDPPSGLGRNSFSNTLLYRIHTFASMVDSQKRMERFSCLEASLIDSHDQHFIRLAQLSVSFGDQFVDGEFDSKRGIQAGESDFGCGGSCSNVSFVVTPVFCLSLF